MGGGGKGKGGDASFSGGGGKSGGGGGKGGGRSGKDGGARFSMGFGYGSSGARGGAKPQDVRQLLQGQGVLPQESVELFTQQLQGFRLSQLPPTSGEAARGWDKVREGWSLLGNVLWDIEEDDDAETQLWYAAGERELHGDPRQIERELMRSNKLAHYLYLSLHPHLVAQRFAQQDAYAAADDMPKVMMVAEKPSVCKMIAEHLSGGRMRMKKGVSRACQIYEFITWFPPAGQKCKLQVTSVVGHVFGLDFNKEDNRGAWNDPSVLYDARCEKIVEETTAKLKVVEHLQELAQEAEYLVLWLDCDREGENIGFEVIGICREEFPTDENIYRAQFSALTETEMKRAINTLVRPNKYMSMAVDARQELDLKIGVSFTRLLTRQLLENCKEKFYRDLKVISYGPCQTPTLWFCVQRHNEIQNFERQTYWTPKAWMEVPGIGEVEFEWEDGKTFDADIANKIHRVGQQGGSATMGNVTQEQKSVRRPVGLNTVQLLKAASTGMGMSPVVAMKAAEHLYTSGYISYPRTESTRYPESFDVREALVEQSWHPNWGKTANYILQHNPNIRPPHGGHDAGDHPPITPVKMAPRDEISKGKEWKLYDYIARHFIASLMDDFTYTEHKMSVNLGGFQFMYRWHSVQERGFMFAMPWKQKDLHLNEVQRVPRLGQPGSRLRVTGVECEEDYTRPPDYLKESELIDQMDKHGIGTDASIPTHVQNICDRRYVNVCGPGDGDGKAGKPILTEQQLWKLRQKNPGEKIEQPTSRHMVPTGLGLALIEGYKRIDKELCEPGVRSFMETQVASIADGSCSLQDVLEQNIKLFSTKFRNFKDQMGVLEPIFRPKYQAGGSYRDYGGGSGWDDGWHGDWNGGSSGWGNSGGGGGKGRGGGGKGKGKSGRK